MSQEELHGLLFPPLLQHSPSDDFADDESWKRRVRRGGAMTKSQGKLRCIEREKCVSGINQVLHKFRVDVYLASWNEHAASGDVGYVLMGTA